MTYYDLVEIAKINKFANLDDFLKKIKMTEDELIKIVCKNELQRIQQQFPNRILFTPRQAALLLDTSCMTLIRRRDNFESIPFVQSKSYERIKYNIKHIAMQLYIAHNSSSSDSIVIVELFQKHFKNLELKRMQKMRKGA